jgi:hypothetical protein
MPQSGRRGRKRFGEEETPDLVDHFIAATYAPRIRIAGIFEHAPDGSLSRQR